MKKRTLNSKMKDLRNFFIENTASFNLSKTDNEKNNLNNKIRIKRRKLNG